MFDTAEKVLVLLHEGRAALHRRELAIADRLFAATIGAVQTLPREQAQALFPVAVCQMSLLRLRQGRNEESAKLRKVAATLLDTALPPLEIFSFHIAGATVLMDLAEYRRAIPFLQDAIRLLAEKNEPLPVAELLSAMGDCYNRTGLKDHAAVPLRAALKIYREHPGDPQLPGVLLSLGNALRKSVPAEAELLYNEAAEFYNAKAQLESAAPAWVNLGVLCSEQGRHAEALAYYDRALHVRELSPGTPPGRLGSLHNNIANCYRRMGNFAEAHRRADRAIALLEKDGSPGLGSAYGTRALVFRDEGRDAEAVEWFAKAYAERAKLPSPNLEDMANDLEEEAAALSRLRRLEEADAVRVRLAATREAIKAGGQSSVDLPLANSQAAPGSSHADGAVLIELSGGSRTTNSPQAASRARLMAQLTEAAQRERAGHGAGAVFIPESTTLMFYGPDAEALFRSLEPVLRQERTCAGATVLIRQGSEVRNVVLPGTVM